MSVRLAIVFVVSVALSHVVASVSLLRKASRGKVGFPLLCFLLLMAMPSALAKDTTVVLLHGLARTSRSMVKMERALEGEGYRVLNISYPSRKHPVEELAKQVRSSILAQVPEGEPLYFVTHSLGGIIVRYLQQSAPLPNATRLVMLSPPNHGSEVVDKLRGWRPFHWINGPAGAQLGTEPDGLVASLKPPTLEVGVITGDRSINWILSCFIPGPDDGKISVESARLEGMQDFLVVHATHPYIMRKREVLGATIRFLESGRFQEIP